MTAHNGTDGRHREDLAERLGPVARRVRFQAGSGLALDDFVYFPLDAVAMLVVQRANVQFQVGFAARGDAIGLQRLMVPEFPPISAKVLKTGTFICVPAGTLERLMREDSQLKDRLSAYALRTTCRFLDEAAFAVALNLECRVARWIARCRDIVESDTLPITHQELATSLGVRRSGVTVALHILEGEHLIRSQRRRIEVLDRHGLVRFSHRRGELRSPAEEKIFQSASA